MNTAAAEWMEARARAVLPPGMSPEVGAALDRRWPDGFPELAAVIKLGEAFRDAVADFLDTQLSDDMGGCACRFCRWADHAAGNPEVDYRRHARRDLDAAMYCVETMLAIVPDSSPRASSRP